jgi:hypothetical protein
MFTTTGRQFTSKVESIAPQFGHLITFPANSALRSEADAVALVVGAPHSEQNFVVLPYLFPH